MSTAEAGSRGRGRPALIGRERIVAAALDLIEENGIEGFTMRELAQRLNTAPTAAYHHVGDREQLLQLAVDEVLGRLHPPEGVDWYQRLGGLELNIRKGLQQYPGLNEYMLRTAPETPNAQRLGDEIRQLLAAGGLPRSKTRRVANSLIKLMAGELIMASLSEDPTLDELDFAASLHALLLGNGLQPTMSPSALVRWHRSLDRLGPTGR